jgi:REJ domain
VVARDPSGGQSPAASAQVVVDNTAPTSGAVTITPSSPTAGQTLTATPTGFVDADGDPLTYQYTWFHNGQLIARASNATLPGSAVVAGETITVQVVASDGHGAQSSAAKTAVNVSASSGGGTGALNVTVASPAARYYRLGSTVLVKYACDATSGVASCTATLGPVGGKASTVTSGQNIRLSRTGRYVLRISAGDTGGNPMTKTVTFRVTADRTKPSISVLSPSAASYRLGQMLLVKYSATDPIGVASTSATLGPVGGKTSKVSSGKKVQLSIRGRYVLRITAKDRVGNSSVKTVYFRVK